MVHGDSILLRSSFLPPGNISGDTYAGSCPDPLSGWITLHLYCVTCEHVQEAWSNSFPDEERQNNDKHGLQAAGEKGQPCITRTDSPMCTQSVFSPQIT